MTITFSRVNPFNYIVTQVQSAIAPHVAAASRTYCRVAVEETSRMFADSRACSGHLLV